ncbi:hypothetical protein HN51_024389 [Arachis hypogaea]
MQKRLNITRRLGATLQNTVLSSVMGHFIPHRSGCFFFWTQRLALFQMAMRGIQSLCKELELDYKAFHGGVRVTGENVGATDAVVRDLVVAQPKGAPKLGKRKGHCIRRRCSCCKDTGHTKRTCPAKGDNDDNQGWRDNPCDGNDSDMADRDNEDLCDDMYFDPNGTGDNA